MCIHSGGETQGSLAGVFPQDAVDVMVQIIARSGVVYVICRSAGCWR